MPSLQGSRRSRLVVAGLALGLLAALGEPAPGAAAAAEGPVGRATAKRHWVPVYARAGGVGEKVATLMRGDAVTVEFTLTTGDGTWCHVTGAGPARAAGYVRCDELDREPTPLPRWKPPAKPSEASPARGAVLRAAREGDVAALQSLLAQGVDQATKNGAFRTAALHGNADAVRAVLAAGPEVDHRDRNDQTTLFLAANSGHTEVVQVLLAAGANVNAPSIWGGSPLQAAAFHGHAETVQVLLAAGGDVRARDQRGQTALIAAAAMAGRVIVPGRTVDHPEVVRLLLAAGAEVNARDEEGRTALMHAARGGHVGTVRALLVGGADVHAVDRYAGTALREASEGGHLPVARLLQQAGARE